MKLVRLIKMCLNETYSKIHIGKHCLIVFLSMMVKKTRRCFITTAFQFNFRICPWEGAGKSGGTEIEWGTSASGLS
jgi:hypothetical protein